MNLEILCRSVCDLALDVGDFVYRESKTFSSDAIELKGKSNIVSYVDKQAEEMLVERLRVLLPEAGFITEEGTATDKGEQWNWIIDPLDGTTNFVHGLPCYSVCIALMEGDSIVLGVVFEVNFRELFYAWKGGGAWLNSDRISVSPISSLSNSLVAVGFPYKDEGRMGQYVQLLHHLQKNSHGVRRLGSAATDMVYVACGRLESFVELGLSPWDVAAGALIVTEAGGTVTDLSGGANYIFGKEILASNGATHQDFLTVSSDFFQT